MAIQLSEDQSAALEAIMDFIASPRSRMVVGGLAGTGKSTLIQEIVRKLERKLSVCAFTGKAASVLTRKGIEASTMHRLIYAVDSVCPLCDRSRSYEPGSGGCFCPLRRLVPAEARFVRLSVLPWPLVVVDEASMVNGSLMADLEAFPVKILYVGDHGQLEPIGDNPNIMKSPDVVLEKIHRQAEGSPIIQFAHHVREGYAPRSFGPQAELRRGSPPDFVNYDVILCGFNHTRADVNARVRARRAFKGKLPNHGETVVCLRNHSGYGVFNGMTAIVTKIRDCRSKAIMTVVDDVGSVYPDMEVLIEQFGANSTMSGANRDLSLWDFGYALTVHKSQGSEWKRVLVLEQIGQSWSVARWRYTAATRASEQLTYCIR